MYELCTRTKSDINELKNVPKNCDETIDIICSWNRHDYIVLAQANRYF